MSKNHTSESQGDIDADIQDFLQNQKAKPVVSNEDYPDPFGPGPQKKKSFLQRLIPAFLQRNRQVA